MTAAMIVVTASTIALFGVLVAGLIRNQRLISAAPDDLDDRVARSAAGAPGGGGVIGTAPDGSPLTVDLGGVGDRTLLAFLSSSCVTCRGLWAGLDGDLTGSPSSGTRVLIVTEDRVDERPDVVGDLAPRDLPVVMSTATWRRFGVSAAPFFVLVEGSSGRVLAAGSAADRAELLRLVQMSAGI